MRAQVREDAILLAAMGLLSEVGYDRMTIDAVAERARASKATIYRKWTGKAELVGAAIRRYAGTTISPPPPTGNLRDDLLGTLRVLRAGLSGQDAALVLGLLVAMRHDPDLALTVRRHVLDHKREVFAVVLERAVERGDGSPAVDHALLAEITSATLLSRLLVTDQPLDDEFLRDLVDSVLLPLITHGSDRP